MFDFNGEKLDIPADAQALFKGFKIGGLSISHNMVRARRLHATLGPALRRQLGTQPRAVRRIGRARRRCRVLPRARCGAVGRARARAAAIVAA